MAKADEDAMTQEMADEAMAGVNTEDEWEEVRVGLGRQWDFDKEGDLTALYVGIGEVALAEDKRGDDGRDKANYHSFGLLDGSGEIVFIWGSYELDNAMTEVGVNDKVRISSLGRESFSSDSGPRQVKRYRVQKAVKK